MKAPKCTICGADHWSRQPHVWGGAKASDDDQPPVAGKPAPPAAKANGRKTKAGASK